MHINYLEVVHVGRGVKLHYAARGAVVTCCGMWNIHPNYETAVEVNCRKCVEVVEVLNRWEGVK